MVAAGVLCYSILSSRELPEVPSWLPGALAAAGLGSAALLAAAQAVLGDRMYIDPRTLELHLQLGVPTSGPAMEPGSVQTRFTGDEALGNGVFAVRDIPKGTFIAYYEGELLDREQYDRRYGNGPADMVMGVGSAWAIDASGLVADTSAFHAVHINHSADANVVRFTDYRRREVRLYAARDIRAGEELRHTYSAGYWAGREHLLKP